MIFLVQRLGLLGCRAYGRSGFGAFSVDGVGFRV